MKVSVITICRNAEKEIERTIKSVLMQNIDKKEMEYIIVDGASTDNTLSIIKKYKKIADENGYNLRYISEPDKGIYDAMNKGTKMATGEWCIYMNAGDRFFKKNSLKYLLDETGGNDVVYGNEIFKHVNCDTYKYEKAIPNIIKNLDLTNMPVFHQATIVRTSIAKKYLYSLKYKIVSDYEFFLRVYLAGYKFHYVNHCISVFSFSGISYLKFGDCFIESEQVAYKYHVVTEQQHQKRMIKARFMKFLQDIRKYIPKSIRKIRQNYLYSKLKLYTWKEITERFD